MAFTIAHPGVTCALLGARTEAHLDDLLAGLDVTLSDDVLDRIDEIVPPGTDVGALDQAYQPPALEDVEPAPQAPRRTRRGLSSHHQHTPLASTVSRDAVRVPSGGTSRSIRWRPLARVEDAADSGRKEPGDVGWAGWGRGDVLRAVASGVLARRVAPRRRRRAGNVPARGAVARPLRPRTGRRGRHACGDRGPAAGPVALPRAAARSGPRSRGDARRGHDAAARPAATRRASRGAGGCG